MLSIFILKILIFILRKFTSNSATALPGLIMERYFPNQLKKFMNQFDRVIFVTGTNGKTTTSKIITHLLKKNTIPYVSNTSGSNLLRGILSELIDKSTLSGKLGVRVAIFEVEEATMPKLVKFLKPDVIVVTNIFRDQLDAYGEIDKTYSYIKEAIINANNPKLVLNDNDMRVKSLKEFTQSSVDFISFEEKYLNLIKFENRDFIENSNNENDDIYQIRNILINDDLITTFDLYLNDGIVLKNYKMLTPGYHNTFNAAAAVISFMKVLGLRLETFDEKSTNMFIWQNYTDSFANTVLQDPDVLHLEIDDFPPAFGRGEKIQYQNTNFQILLGKNPAGLNLNFKLLESIKKREAILLLLNDNTADGKDVSWIWDCDFSILKNIGFENVFIGGTRRFDMALRVKYEGIPLSKTKSEIDTEKSHVFENLSDAIDALAAKNYEKVFVLPTYTAMLQFRKELNKRTEVKKMYD